jgi:hypothetical protein
VIIRDDHKGAFLPVRRLGLSCAAIFTLAVIALDVTETLAVVRRIGVDDLSIALGLINPLSFWESSLPFTSALLSLSAYGA